MAKTEQQQKQKQQTKTNHRGIIDFQGNTGNKKGIKKWNPFKKSLGTHPSYV